mmetsp:Transcript_182037/g.442905  ORF Transcript_182037/g.442905 Transcript_182037/m.442905 type:complete len:318 (+) Transcript_182037:38-991(+)
MITLSTGVSPEGAGFHTGVCFDLRARSSHIQIISITCASMTADTASIYACKGTASGKECDEVKWSLVGKGALRGDKKETQVALSSPISLSPGSRAGVKVHCSGYVYFSNTKHAEAICAEDANLQLLPGRYTIGATPFAGPPCNHVMLAGAITYAKVEDLPANATGKLLWSDPVFSDLAILAGARSFPAHRAMLAAASSVFRRMLEAPMRENLEHRIEIDATPEAVECVLKYIYTGEPPPHSQAHDVLPLAHRYELTDLAKCCSSLLVSRFSASTAQDVILALRPFKHMEPMQQAWDELIRLAESDPQLVRPFIRCLA